MLSVKLAMRKERKKKCGTALKLWDVPCLFKAHTLMSMLFLCGYFQWPEIEMDHSGT